MNIPPEAAETVKRLWSNANLSMRDIGREVGRAASTIGRWGAALGLEPRPRKHDGWPDERKEHAVKLWGEGMTAKEIALDMGLTRSAVLGKIQRLGLCGRSHVNNPGPKPMPKPRLPKGNGKRRPFIFSMAPNRTRTPPVEATELGQDAPELEPLRLTFDDLGPYGKCCRWPMWPEGAPEADRRYCGLKAKDHAFCPHHRRRAVSKVLRPA